MAGLRSKREEGYKVSPSRETTHEAEREPSPHGKDAVSGVPQQPEHCPAASDPGPRAAQARAGGSCPPGEHGGTRASWLESLSTSFSQ